MKCLPKSNVWLIVFRLSLSVGKRLRQGDFDKAMGVLSILKGEQHLKCWLWLGDLEWYLKGKKLIEQNKHYPWASKCHSSDTIRAGVCPLNINSKNEFYTHLKSTKTKTFFKSPLSHHFSSQIISKVFKIFANLYQLRYCVAMIQICMLINCNRGIRDYDW